MGKKIYIIFTIVISFLIISYTNNSHNNIKTTKVYSSSIPEVFKKNLNIAVISEYTNGEFRKRYLEGIASMSKKLGINVEFLDCGYDKANFSYYIDSSIAKKVDGILVSYISDYSISSKLKKCLKYGIPVVCFDSEINIPGIINIYQDDEKLAELCLNKMFEDIDYNGNIIYIYSDGCIPIRKRDFIYNRMMKYGNIKEIARFGQIGQDASLITQVNMKNILEKNPQKHSIKAVWATWDEFAKGANKAIKELNRDEIKLYGVDISNEDIEILKDRYSQWTATAAVDSYDIGEVQVRILACKLANIDVPEKYSFKPILITKDMLPEHENITMENLSNFVPGWDKNMDFYPEWMKELENLNCN